MKRLSASWREGTTHQRTYIAVVDSTPEGSKVHRIRIRSYAGEAVQPKDDPDRFFDAICSHLSVGVESERAVALAEAECPPPAKAHPKLLDSVAIANFDEDSQIVRAIQCLIGRETNTTSVLVTRLY
jgi:hypothetical protein